MEAGSILSVREDSYDDIAGLVRRSVRGYKRPERTGVPARAWQETTGTFKPGDLRDCAKEQFTRVGGDPETSEEQ